MRERTKKSINRPFRGQGLHAAFWRVLVAGAVLACYLGQAAPASARPGQHVDRAGNAGSTWSWGRDYFGQLGDGSSGFGAVRRYPGPVTGLENASAIAAGAEHSLAVRQDGTAWAWGKNDSGQLGTGTREDSAVPVQVMGLTKGRAVGAGWAHSLALDADGDVWAWGSNASGELGNGTTTGSPVPVRVSGLSEIQAISVGSGATPHNLALKADGTVWAWGSNFWGELGDGTTTDRLSPVQVSGLTNVVAIAAGTEQSLAVDSDGTVWAWGSNYDGQLGTATATMCNGIPCSASPIQVTGLDDVTAVAAGSRFSLALKNDGSVWSWGQNAHGELGNGTCCADQWTPDQVTQLPRATSIAAGSGDGLAVSTDGTAWAWGDNSQGQLGNGVIPQSRVPLQVTVLPQITALAAGDYHALAVIPAAPTLPLGPSSLVVDSVTGSSARLSWKDNANNETGYIVERRQGGGIFGELGQAQPIDSTSFVDLNLDPDAGYTYRVKAINELGSSPFSNQVGLTAAPAAPTALVATWVRATSVEVAWTDGSTAESGFEVERSTAGGDYVQIATVGPNVVRYGDGDLAPETAYRYRVRAYNDSGRSDYSNELEVSTSARPANDDFAAATMVSTLPARFEEDVLDATMQRGEPSPAPNCGQPLMLSVWYVFTALATSTITVSTLDSNFHTVAGVYTGDPPSSSTLVACNDGNRLTGTDRAVVSFSTRPGGTYFIQVGTANLSILDGTNLKMDVTGIDHPPAGLPSNLTVTSVTPTRVGLSWKVSSLNQVTGFLVERKTGSGIFATVGTTPASVTSFTDETVEQGTTYTYRVRSVNGSAQSPPSNQATASTYRRVEDDATEIGYQGAWSSHGDDRASGGSVHLASASSAKATLTWTGTALQVLMAKGPQMGKVKITLDGTATTVDLYAASLSEEVVYSKQYLASKSRSLSLTPTGTKNSHSHGTSVALDAFDVR
jgi:alpha-tubulin suppressor-like RCC1 family protein/fibronectin type 3 domain-containing protein